MLGDCLLFVRVSVLYHLHCNGAFQRRGAEVRDKDSAAYRGKDTNQVHQRTA
jgi:hypothetical protein